MSAGIRNPRPSQASPVIIHGGDPQNVSELCPVYAADGRLYVDVDSGQALGSQTFTRTMFQATSLANGTYNYTVALDGIDLSTATVVCAVSAGSITLNGQVSYDGVNEKRPGTPFEIFPASTTDDATELAQVSGFIYGHIMTGEVILVSGPADIEIFLMAQGK